MVKMGDKYVDDPRRTSNMTDWRVYTVCKVCKNGNVKLGGKDGQWRVIGNKLTRIGYMFGINMLDKLTPEMRAKMQKRRAEERVRQDVRDQIIAVLDEAIRDELEQILFDLTVRKC